MALEQETLNFGEPMAYVGKPASMVQAHKVFQKLIGNEGVLRGRQ